MLHALARDVRFTFRLLAGKPAFTCTAVLALAFGIGATVLVFSAVDAVLLAPLPFPNAERLVVVWERDDTRGLPRMLAAPPNYQDWVASAASFESLSAYDPTSFTLGGGAEPEQVRGVRVSASMFATLGIRTVAGRSIALEEDRPDAARVALISTSLWQRRFGAAADVVGRELRINDEPHEIIGVLPSHAGFPPPLALEGLPTNSVADVWVPLVLDYASGQRGAHYLSVLGRLRPGVTLEQADREMKGIAARLAAAYPESNRDWSTVVASLQAEITAPVRGPLLLLSVAGALVLAIACANLANLLLASGLARRREMAIRLALGSGRARLLRLSATESVIIALMGGALGLILGAIALVAMRSAGADSLPRFETIAVNGRVAVFALALSLVCGFALAFATASTLGQLGLQQTLRAQATSVKGARSPALQRSFVIAQIALSIALLIGAGLLVRSFLALRATDPGFRASSLLAADITLAGPRYDDNAARAHFAQAVLERLADADGVQSATLISDPPIDGDRQGTSFQAAIAPLPANEQPHTNFALVAPSYFRVLGIPVIAGRAFVAGDVNESTPVVLINDAFRRRYFPDRDPVGLTIRLGFNSQTVRHIAGVVGDERYLGLDRPAGANVYLPYAQVPRSRRFSLLVRSDRDPAALARGTRAIVRAIDPGLAVYNVRTMAQVVDASLMRPRLSSRLLAIFAMLAAALAAVGLYGVIAYGVRQRIPEVGVRLALGASPGSVVRMIMREGLTVTAAGVAAGFISAAVLARVMSSLLFGVRAWDPATWLLVLLFIIAVGTIACGIPALRASRVDPLQALRHE